MVKRWWSITWWVQTMFRLVTNKNYQAELTASRDFPKRLSQTGLFANTSEQAPAPGVRPFTINHAQWQDGAVGKHFLALPEQSQVTVFNEPQPVGVLAMFNSRLHYPTGTVLAKTSRCQLAGARAMIAYKDRDNNYCTSMVDCGAATRTCGTRSRPMQSWSKHRAQR